MLYIHGVPQKVKCWKVGPQRGSETAEAQCKVLEVLSSKGVNACLPELVLRPRMGWLISGTLAFRKLRQGIITKLKDTEISRPT